MYRLDSYFQFLATKIDMCRIACTILVKKDIYTKRYICMHSYMDNVFTNVLLNKQYLHNLEHTL